MVRIVQNEARPVLGKVLMSVKKNSQNFQSQRIFFKKREHTGFDVVAKLTVWRKFKEEITNAEIARLNAQH